MNYFWSHISGSVRTRFVKQELLFLVPQKIRLLSKWYRRTDIFILFSECFFPSGNIYLRREDLKKVLMVSECQLPILAKFLIKKLLNLSNVFAGFTWYKQSILLTVLNNSMDPREYKGYYLPQIQSCSQR